MSKENVGVGAWCVDPNTLNLGPDPKVWPNLDPDQGFINFERKIIFFNKGMFFIL